MDKFFYRLTLQTVIKAILTALISLFVTALFYTLFVSILQPISGQVDYWLQAVVAFVTTVITCFMLISVKDSYTSVDTYTYQVGRFWSGRVHHGKKVRWFSVELMMLPLLAIAVWAAYLFYRSHADVLATYEAFYAAEGVSAGQAQDLFFNNLLHFSKIIFAVFFFAQWVHVRAFAKDGRCPSCKAAFALGLHQTGARWSTTSSRITQKSKTTVVGGIYQVTSEDGEEIDRTKIADKYDRVYENYQTDTKTTYSSSLCRCAFCDHISQKTDVYSTSSTRKLP